MSTKAEKKAEGERNVFALFAQAMNWPLDEGLIRSRPEPEPDILYDNTDGKIAFELVENCLEGIAENNSLILEGAGEIVLRVSDPTGEVIQSKISKRYSSDYPIELLCYSNGRLGTPNDLVVTRMRNQLETAKKNPFRRVWYFGKKNEVFMVWQSST